MTSNVTKKPPVARKKPPAAKKAAAPRKTRRKPDTSQESIAHVPDESIIDEYVSRDLPLGKGEFIRDMDLFDFCYENGMNLLIEGPTGPGKTMATKTWCAMRGMMLARVPSFSGVEASQLFGKHNPNKETGGFTWIDGPITHVVRNGGCILVNEVNFLPERISTILFGLLDGNREIVLLDHEGEVIRAHRGAGKCWCTLPGKACDKKRILVVADMNPDYLGTRELNIAFRNRWGMKIQWDYDPNVESQLVESRSLLSMANKLRKQLKDGNIETPTSTNMLIEFERVAKGLSVDFAIQNFINAYRADEREAVKLVCEAHSADLATQLTPPKPTPKKAPPKSSDPNPASPSSLPPDDPASTQAVMDGLASWVFTS